MRHVYFAVAIAVLLALSLAGSWHRRADAAAKNHTRTILSAQIGGISLTLTVADSRSAWQPERLPA